MDVSIDGYTNIGVINVNCNNSLTIPHIWTMEGKNVLFGIHSFADETTYYALAFTILYVKSDLFEVIPQSAPDSV